MVGKNQMSLFFVVFGELIQKTYSCLLTGVVVGMSHPPSLPPHPPPPHPLPVESGKRGRG